MFPKVSRVKKILSVTCPIVECVSEYAFLISKNIKETDKQKQESKKAKVSKEEKRTSPENRLKNKFAVARDFSRPRHFQKQVIFLALE